MKNLNTLHKHNNPKNNTNKKLTAKLVDEAYERLKPVVLETPLQYNERLSKQYKASVYLKREDLQLVRSYKLRGAYNKIAQLSTSERKRGVVCASAGNHAQGVAFACSTLKIKGYIYMPENTPKQKVDRVRVLGGHFVEIVLVGDTYDEAYKHAMQFCNKKNSARPKRNSTNANTKKVFVHPFDDVDVAAGQGTVALEILKQTQKKVSASPDFVFVPVGGGGLLSGLGTYLAEYSPSTKIIGVEPEGAPSMTQALHEKKVTTLSRVDKFIDGAAVKTVGELSFAIAKKVLTKMLIVPEGRVCQEMLALYQSDGIITEPAGALSVSVLEQCKDEIKGKTVVCVVSGGNNDVSRYPEIVERSLVYQGLKYYFIVEFSQRPGALRNYLDHVLGTNDDIVLFEYIKKSNKENGPALVGIEMGNKKDLPKLLLRMDRAGLQYELLQRESPLFRFLV